MISSLGGGRFFYRPSVKPDLISATTFSRFSSFNSSSDGSPNSYPDVFGGLKLILSAIIVLKALYLT